MRPSLVSLLALVSAVSAASYDCAGGHNNAWVLATDFEYTADAFCDHADGAFIFQEFPFSDTYDILLTPRDGKAGVPASVTFSISNTERTPVFVNSWSTCYDIMKGFSASGASCAGSLHDTKGGTATDGSIKYTVDIHPDVNV